jgi:excisionase family DNA binding protein
MLRLPAGEYLTADEAASLLGLKPYWVRELTRRGQLPAYRVGWECLYPREAVEAEASARGVRTSPRERPRAA